uniref:Uncharacterized protein n=1 Tax=viral metagenome TaxID=1070528 RepID=A0A2V0RIM2_9ZZZZ
MAKNNSTNPNRRKKPLQNLNNRTRTFVQKQAKKAPRVGKAIKDVANVAKAGAQLNPGQFGEMAVNTYQQSRKGNYPLSGTYNVTEAIVSGVGESAVVSSNNLMQLWKDVGIGKPEQGRSTSGTYSDPSFTANRDRRQGPTNSNQSNPSTNMPNRKRGGDADSSHPSSQYSGDASSAPINPFNSSVLTGSPIKLNSYIDKQYQMNPYQDQVTDIGNTDADNSSQFKRTHVNVIDTTNGALFNFEGNSRMKVSFNRIFQDLRQEIVAEINANQFTDKVFTKVNFDSYIKTVSEAWALLAELQTRKGFESSYAEQNLILRGISNSMAGNVSLLVAISSLETILKKFALPIKLIEYYKWLAQVYKCTPVEGGKHYIQASPYMISSLHQARGGLDDWTDLIIKLEDITDALYSSSTFSTSSNTGNWFTLSQYLVKYTSTGNFTDIGNCMSYCTQPVYDVNANAIWDNCVSYQGVSVGTSMFGRLSIPNNEDAMVAFPHDEDCVPAYITSHLLPLWANTDFTTGSGQTGGFPFYGTYMKDVASIPAADRPTWQPESNNVILFTSGNSWSVDVVNESWDYITDHIWTVQYSSTGDRTAMNMPKGMNTRYYSPSYTNTTTASVNLMYDMFGIPLDFG